MLVIPMTLIVSNFSYIFISSIIIFRREVSAIREYKLFYPEPLTEEIVRELLEILITSHKSVRTSHRNIY